MRDEDNAPAGSQTGDVKSKNIDPTKDTAANAGGSAGQSASGAGGSAGQSASSAGGSAGQAASGAGGSAVQAASGAGGSASQAVSGAGGSAGQSASGAGGSAVQAASGAGGSASQAASGAGGSAVQAASGAGGSASQAASGAGGSAVQAAMDVVKADNTSIISKVANALKDSKLLIPSAVVATTAIVVGTVIIVSNSKPSPSVPVEKNPPRIQGNLTYDWINLEEFTPDSPVTVEVFDYEGGPSVGEPQTVQTDGDGNVSFNGRDFEINLQPGMFIQVTDDDSDIVGEITLEDLSIDVFDTDQDIVAGKGPPETSLWVNVHDEVLNEGYGTETSADSDGNWSVDFKEEVGVDLNENMNPQVSVSGGDGSGTIAEFPGDPSLQANLPLDWISATLLTPDSSATLWIYESEGGPQVAGSPFTVSTNWLGEMTFEGSENGVDLLPGMHIVVQDHDLPAIEKEVSLVEVTIETPDFENNVLNGTGPENTLLTVEVFNHENGEEYFMEVLTDENGNWTVDFISEFNEPIPNGDRCAHIKFYDEDGDASVADPVGPP